jgi:hypothetical protein
MNKNARRTRRKRRMVSEYLPRWSSAALMSRRSRPAGAPVTTPTTTAALSGRR